MSSKPETPEDFFYWLVCITAFIALIIGIIKLCQLKPY